MALLAASPLNAQEPPAPKPDVPESATGGAEATAEADANHPEVELTLSNAGHYLAARQAALDSDFVAASRYYALALGQNGTDPYLLDSTLVSMISAGEIAKAVHLAQQATVDGNPDTGTELSQLVLRVEMARTGDWDGLLARSEAAMQGSPNDDATGEGRLLDGMIHAWALLGAGKAGT